MPGYAPADMAGRPISDLMDAPGADACRHLLANPQETTERHDFELLARDGRRVYASVSVSAIAGKNGSHDGSLAMVTDVSQARKTREALRSSEERYRNVYSMTPLAFVLWDSACAILDWNRRAEEMFGWTKEEVAGKDFFEFLIPPGEKAPVKDLVARILKTKEPTLSENRNATKDGRVIDCEWYTSVLHGDMGQVEGAISLGLDITERKRTQKALKESEERHLGLYRAISGGVVMQDRSGRIVEANPAACEILGMTLDQMRGLTSLDPLWHAIHEDGSPFPGEDHPVIETLRTGKRVRGVVMGVFNPALQKYRWVIVNSEPILDLETGQAQAAVATFLDITGRREAEQALRESEERFRLLSENIDQVFWFTEVEPERVLYVSKAHERIWGVPPEALYRNPRLWMEQVHPEDRARVQDAFGSWISGQAETYDVEYRILRPDGETRWIEDRGTVIAREQGRPRQLSGIAKDITERKRAQEEIASLARFPAENPYPVMRLGKDGVLIYANPASNPLLKEWGCQVGDPAPPFLSGPAEEAFAHQAEKELEFHCGGRTYSFIIYPIPEASYVNLYGRDVTAQKAAEDRLKSAFLEAEVLLKEVHHRVKNNLQIISTLLQLKADSLTDEEAQHAFKDSESRVRAMALVHEKLYQSENVARVDLATYVGDLASYLFSVYGLESSKIRLETAIEDVPMSVDTAIPIGLILNELISNALKHAFPEGRSGRLFVGLRKRPGGVLELTVSDEGAGIPEGLDFRNTESLGLQLVNILIRQLGGSIERVPGPGTTFRMTFQESMGRHKLPP